MRGIQTLLRSHKYASKFIIYRSLRYIFIKIYDIKFDLCAVLNAKKPIWNLNKML